MKNLLLLVTSIVFITSCGGGGGGGGSAPAMPTPTAATANLTLNNSKGYVGGTVTVTWSSTNASSCTASNAWSGTKATSGSESFSLNSAGSFTFAITCMGTGGNGTSSKSFVVFEYDKQTTDVTNKSWDAEGFASIVDFNTNPIGLDYSGDGTNLLTVTAFEPSNSTFELNYSGATPNGNPFDFNLKFNDWNTSTTLWYDSDDTSQPAYASINSSFADATVNGFLTLPDYYASKGIEYVSSAFVEILRNDIYYVIPTNVGEFTDLSDMPTSGTDTKSFETLGYYFEPVIRNNKLAINYIVADGEGTLDFDFANNTVSGSVTYDTFVPYESFKNGTAVYNLITSIPAQTITLENGVINGNSFGAIVVIDDGVTKGRGIIKGHFYGPNADEIAINIFLGDVNDNADDYFHLTAGGLGQ